VAVISLATGAARDLAIGPYQGKQTGEPALFRSLWDRLGEGDIAEAAMLVRLARLVNGPS